MADKKISELAIATIPLAGTEEIPIVQGGITKKTTIDSILENSEPIGKIRIVDKLGEFFTDLATANAYVSSFTLAPITNESYEDGVYYFTVPNGSSFAELDEFLAYVGAYIEDTLGLINAFSVSAFELNTANNILGNCIFGQGAFGNSSGHNIVGNCTFVNGCFEQSTGNNILGDCVFANNGFEESTGNNILRNCTFGIGGFLSSTGNNTLGNCTFGEDAFNSSSSNNAFGDCTFGNFSFTNSSGINKFKNILLTNPTDSFAPASAGRFEIYGNIGTDETTNYTNFFLTSTATIWADKSKETINAGGLEGDLATAQTNGATLFFGYDNSFSFSFYQEGQFNTALFGGSNAGIWLKRNQASVNYFGITTGISDKTSIIPDYISQSYIVPQRCKISSLTNIQANFSDWEVVIFKSDNLSGLNAVEVYHLQYVGYSETISDPGITINSGDYLHFFFKRPVAGNSFYKTNLIFETI